MRILHITDRQSARGGADWHLLGVIAALAERGHQQLLAVGRDDGSVPAPCEVRRIPGLAQTTRPAEVAAPLSELRASFKPQVIHIHNALGPAALGWAADHGAVATVQDHRSFCPGRGKLTATGEVCSRPMERDRCATCFEDEGYHRGIHGVTEARLAALRRMDALVVLSAYMRRELVAAGVAAERITVIPPFVHGLPKDTAPEGPGGVVFAGRLVAAKGVGDALRAWQDSGITLPLVVAGTGPLRSQLEGIDGVEVLGWVAHERLGGLLRGAAALVLPSRWQEPFGIIGLEALSLGTAVAAWRSGGVAEWHPGGELLVDWGDVGALAEAIRRAVGQRAMPPGAFARDELMDRLVARYHHR